VGRVHGIALERQVERAGAAQHLFLGAGSLEEPAARLYSIGEVQGQRPRAALGQSSPGTHGRFVGDDGPSVFEEVRSWRGERCLGRERLLGGDRSLDREPPIHGATVGGGVVTGARCLEGRLPEGAGVVPRDLELSSAGLRELRVVESGFEAKGHGPLSPDRRPKALRWLWHGIRTYTRPGGPT
jgi:hypothetical protein